MQRFKPHRPTAAPVLGIVAGVALAVAGALAPAAQAQDRVTGLVSVGPGTGNGPSDAFFGRASADGTRVFFVTTEPLVAADGDNSFDVYERSGGQTTLVSDRIQDSADGAFDAFVLGASADGTRVFFETAEPLVAADGDASTDVYERAGGQTTLVSDRIQDNGDGAFNATFGGASADGTRVFFETSEPLVTADGDTNRFDIYERSGGQTTLVSDRIQDTADGAFNAFFGGASADGTRVFFDTTEPLVTADGDTDRRDVYERAGGQTTLVSDRIQDNLDGAFDAGFEVASADGARVFFNSSEPLVDGDGDTNRTDVYERAGGQTTLVSDRIQGGGDGAFDAFFGGASADGTRVFFDTNEPLVAGDGDTDRRDVYERSGGQTTLVSDRIQDTTDGAFDAFFGGAAADGTRVFFVTSEPLVAGDGDTDRRDVYERAGGQTTLVSERIQAGADGAFDASFRGASADGTRIFFETSEPLVAADGDASTDVYERAGGQTTLVSERIQAGADGAFDASFRGASADGTRVFFQTRESLVAADGDTDRFDVYQSRTSVPPETVISSGPEGRTTSPVASFAFSASEAGSSFECRLDGAAFAGCSSPFTTPALPDGPHSFEVRATDAEGDVDPSPALRSFTVDTSAPPPPPPPPPPVLDTTAPVLSAVALTNKRFRLAGKKGKAPVGTSFRYRLSEAAGVSILIERVLPGRKFGRRCVAPTRRLRKNPRCTRYVRQGTVTRLAGAGRGSLAFGGMIGRRKLVPGKYRATLVATDAAGNRSRAARLTFTVVRR